VGYTNAGKSTLFNALTQADVYAEDRLFATLDTTLRRLHLPGVGACVLADTVGFIRHIPHDLVAAFRATLEESASASLLIHLVDASDARCAEKIADVQQVLQEIEADDVPQLLVYNKIDACQPPVAPALEPIPIDGVRRVWISAQSGLGFDGLIRAIAEQIEGEQIGVEVILAPHQGRMRAQLYATGQVLTEDIDEAGNLCLTLRLSPQQWQEILDNPDIQQKRRLASLGLTA
jgi:GTP-binding protein HflX